MEMTAKLKERFCKDNSIQIKLFDEPYFTSRLELYDSEFNTLSLWNDFTKNVNAFRNEEEYFEQYNKTKDAAITFITSSPIFKEFNSMDMNKYAVPNEFRNLPGKDIYHSRNVGRTFMSIDMKKANFSSLRSFNKDVFDGATTYEEFISKFTNLSNIIKSKYVRQVIFGQCNCKRHITYEKYITGLFVKDLIDSGKVSLTDIVFFSNDEIVIDITSNTTTDKIDTLNEIQAVCENIVKKFNEVYEVPFRINTFKLSEIIQDGTNIGYVRVMTDGSYDFKCVNHINLPWVLRKIKGEPITDYDLVFNYEGKLAKFMSIPIIEIK